MSSISQVHLQEEKIIYVITHFKIIWKRRAFAQKFYSKDKGNLYGEKCIRERDLKSLVIVKRNKILGGWIKAQLKIEMVIGEVNNEYKTFKKMVEWHIS